MCVWIQTELANKIWQAPSGLARGGECRTNLGHQFLLLPPIFFKSCFKGAEITSSFFRCSGVTNLRCIPGATPPLLNLWPSGKCRCQNCALWGYSSLENYYFSRLWAQPKQYLKWGFLENLSQKCVQLDSMYYIRRNFGNIIFIMRWFKTCKFKNL